MHEEEPVASASSKSEIVQLSINKNNKPEEELRNFCTLQQFPLTTKKDFTTTTIIGNRTEATLPVITSCLRSSAFQ